MAIQFCEDCGNTLPLSGQKVVECRCCGRENKNQLLGVVTTTSTDRFPSKLRDRLVSNIQQVSQKDRGGSLKTSSVPCPKCNAPDMKFAELQLRSADEGATIFYSCSVCDHRFTENN